MESRAATRIGQRPVLLVVDDEEAVLALVARFAATEGFEVVSCAGGREALTALKSRRADLVMVDLRMPDVGGLDVIRAIRQADAQCHIILMTGYASIDTAVAAVKLGATDYLTKPFDLPRLKQLFTTVREETERRRLLLATEGTIAKRLEFCGMIGRGPAMEELFGLIRRLAPHVRTALVTGETGTGKELVARALYKLGPRNRRRFVTVNCSAVVETLFESELFGHKRGAFTGATDDKPGLFEMADGGTLFLDEVGELPLPVQAKLLRVLETGEVQRVGSLTPRRVDAQVIAATNRDLAAEIRNGRFRRDLFYRLNIIGIPLPPLRDRPEDIPYLTAAFVRECARRFGKPVVGLSPAGERVLSAARWDGNVRELRNVVERACILAEGEFLTERDLTGSMQQQTAATAPALAPHLGPAARTAEESPTDGPALMSTVEREHIREALRRTGGNKAAAARLIGVSRRALYRRLERYGLGDRDTRPTV